MDIEHLGEERVFQLVDAGLINDPPDLYDLRVAELVRFDRFAEISANNLVGGDRGVEDAAAQPVARGAGDPAPRADGGPDAGTGVREPRRDRGGEHGGAGRRRRGGWRDRGERRRVPDPERTGARSVACRRGQHGGARGRRERRAAGPAGGAADAVAQTLQGKTVVVTGAVPGYTREGAEEAILARAASRPAACQRRRSSSSSGTRRGRARRRRPRISACRRSTRAGFDALLETGALPE